MVEMDEAILKVNNVLKSNNIQFPKRLIEDLASAYIRRNLTDDELNQLVLKVQESLKNEVSEEGEAVGVIAGQSIGEAIIQMFQGNRNKDFYRIIEILDARKFISNPTMTIYFEDHYKNDEEFVRKVASKIGKNTLKDILSEFNIDYANNRIVVYLDEEKIIDKRLDYYDIIYSIERNFRVVSFEGNKIFFASTRGTIRDLRVLAERIRDFQITGSRGIGNVFTCKTDEEWILHTEGSNLSAIFRIEGIDKVKSTTNDINDIYNVLGIEAARNAIINELYSVFSDQGLNVDIRHIMIVADAMTSEGIVKSVGRYGISGDKPSVLARAAFEEYGKPLLNAGIRGEVDDLTGIIENIIIGQPVPIGTGSVLVTQKRND